VNSGHVCVGVQGICVCVQVDMCICTSSTCVCLHVGLHWVLLCTCVCGYVCTGGCVNVGAQVDVCMHR
jgi:hypothetical protein